MSQKILQWSNKHDRNLIKERLEHNQVVLGSTDTVIGLFAPCNAQGKQRLDEAKFRSEKPYIMLINSLEVLNQWADIIHKQEFDVLIKKAWPGPLTVLLKANKNAPLWIQGTEGTLAFRWPRHQGINDLLTHYDVLLSTSANRSGEPTPDSYASVDPYFIQYFWPIILDDPLAINTISSTIIDCSLWPFKVVRQGAYIINS